MFSEESVPLFVCFSCRLSVFSEESVPLFVFFLAG